MKVAFVSYSQTFILAQVIQNQTSTDYSLLLPDEILFEIFENLSFLELNIVSNVCRRWHAIAKSSNFMLDVFQRTVQKIQKIMIPSLIAKHVNRRVVFTSYSNKTRFATGIWAYHPLSQQVDIAIQGLNVDPDQICRIPDIIFYAHKLPYSNFSISLEFKVKKPLLKRGKILVEEATQRINALLQSQRLTSNKKETVRLFRKLI